MNIDRFIQQECEVGLGKDAKSSALYGRYVEWCWNQRPRVQRISIKAFKRELGSIGIFSVRKNDGIRYEGILIK